MANVVTQQVLEDGPRWYVKEVSAVLDTSDLAETVVIDPTTFAAQTDGTPLLNVALDTLSWSVTPNLTARLQWKAAANVDAFSMVNTNSFRFQLPVTNNSGAGKTGQLVMITNGYTAGTVAVTVQIRALKMLA